MTNPITYSKLFNLILYFILFSCFIISCGTGENKQVADNTPTESGVSKNKIDIKSSEKRAVNATVDGKPWHSSGNGPHAPVGVLATQNTNMNISIQAYGPYGSYIALNTVSISGISETSYSSEAGAFQAQYRPDFTSTDLWTSMLGSGKITFTHIGTDNLSGTFSFEGVNPAKGKVAIENGAFNIDM